MGVNVCQTHHQPNCQHTRSRHPEVKDTVGIVTIRKADSGTASSSSRFMITTQHLVMDMQREHVKIIITSRRPQGPERRAGPRTSCNFQSFPTPFINTLRVTVIAVSWVSQCSPPGSRRVKPATSAAHQGPPGTARAPQNPDSCDRQAPAFVALTLTKPD